MASVVAQQEELIVMAGMFFKYVPGRLDASFSQNSRFDFIGMRLRLRNGSVTTTACDDQWAMADPIIHRRKPESLTVRFSSVFCPFIDLIRFLEAITIGVMECAFDWDAEGPSGTIRWRRRDKESGILTVEYWYARGPVKHDWMLETEQTVRMMYQAFRRFVESDAYDPLRYEELNVREQFELVLDGTSPDALAERVATMDSKGATVLLDCLGEAVAKRQEGGAKVRYSLEHFLRKSKTHQPPVPVLDLPGLIQLQWIDAGWDELSEDARRSDIEHKLFPSNYGSRNGQNLRNLRSERIEHWLHERATQ